MTCVRTPDDQIVSGISVESAPDVTLSLRLAGKPFPITLPGYNASILDDINAKISSAQKDLFGKIDTAIANLTSELKQGGAQGPGNGLNCPSGQYVSGISAASEGGLAHGAIYALSVACRAVVK
jgi:hypothetical protein